MSGPGLTSEHLAVGLVERAVGSAPDADVEVMVEAATVTLTRFANSAIHQNIAEDTTSVRMRVHVDGRTLAATATVTSTADEAALEEFVTGTVDAARRGPRDRGWPGVAPAVPIAPAAAPRDVTAAAARADAVAAFVDAAGGLECAGYCRDIRTARWFANSAGHGASSVTATAGFDGIARNRGIDGVARLAATGLDGIDAGALGRLAAAKSRAGADPVELAPGRYEVLLEPSAVADLLENMATFGFSGMAFNQRQSFVSPGESQFDAAITMDDDPIAVGTTFDSEGTATTRRTFVDGGSMVGVADDRRTAAEGGRVSTGHASTLRWGGPAPRFLGITPAAGSAESAPGPDLVDPAARGLLAGVERAILVSDLWYTRVLDPKALSITGLTRNGVWLVEGGEVVRPLTNFRFTQAYAAALAPGAVLAVGGATRGIPDRWGAAHRAAPALHLRSWNFTGGASG